MDARGAAEVSIGLAPDARGRGRSVPLLQAALDAARTSLMVDVFVAHVRPTNEPSRRLFVRAGFRLEGTVVVRGVSVLEFRQPAARATADHPAGSTPTDVGNWPTGQVVVRFVQDEALIRDRSSAATPRGPGRPEAWVILDPAWTPPSEVAAARDRGLVLGVRDLGAAVLRQRDLFVETTELLDDWAERSRIADRLTAAGVSVWFRRRLGYWWWLHARLLWLGVVDAAVAAAVGAADGAAGTIETDDGATRRPAAGIRLEIPSGADRALEDAARALARTSGFDLFEAEAAVPSTRANDGDAGDAEIESDETQGSTPPDGATTGTARSSIGDLPFVGPLLARAAAWRNRRVLTGRRRAIDRRLARLAAEPDRLLILTDPRSSQRIDTPTGEIVANPFLEPIRRELAGTILDPIVLEYGASLADTPTWTRLSGAGAERSLPADLLAKRFAQPGDGEAGRAQTAQIVADVRTVGEALTAGPVDLGPLLIAEIARSVQASLPGMLRDIRRARRLIRALHPYGLLMINEYGRSEWLAVAGAEGVPVAAVQHGVIHRFHPGYMHRVRHPGLPIPDRLYVFGQFERRLLTGASIYRPDEVVVGGSPRLDLVSVDVPAEALRNDRHRAEIRRALGVNADERMLVISTTFGLIRQFYTPAALAELLDGDLTGVHVVIKTHPNEPDDGFYGRLVASVRDGLGLPPVRLTVIARIDLYRLLAAADAHLGLYSTVLTEAVAVGTPNLLAAGQATSDLLGYVAARVAIPVHDGLSLRTALDQVTAAGIPAEAGRAFLADHFEPGNASARIRDDLLERRSPVGGTVSAADDAPGGDR